MGSFPYTDVSVHYPCGPLAASLIDVESEVKSLTEQNTVAVKTGDGSPPGNGDARGILGETNHFRRNADLDGSAFDCRGLVSLSILGWVRVDSLVQGPYFFSVHDATAANGQAWILAANQPSAPGNQTPEFLMADGLTIFNFIRLKASESAPAMTINVWHAIGASYDHVTNTMACFWGDGNDSSGDTTYFNTKAGYAAGFGYSVDYQQVNVGRFRTAGSVGDHIDVDHISYWKGRAFNEDDFLNHWQAGTGLSRNEFASDPGRSGIPKAAVADMYYYRR